MMSLLFCPCMVYAWIVDNMIYNKKEKIDFNEIIIQNFTKKTFVGDNSNVELKKTVHTFQKGEKRKNRSLCYKRLRKEMNCTEADKRVRKVTIYCVKCEIIL